VLIKPRANQNAWKIGEFRKEMVGRNYTVGDCWVWAQPARIREQAIRIAPPLSGAASILVPEGPGMKRSGEFQAAIALNSKPT
jgi:hypothetical protein